MHRKSMLICVLFILTALVSFNGCASETGEASVNTKIFDTKSDNKAASARQGKSLIAAGRKGISVNRIIRHRNLKLYL